MKPITLVLPLALALAACSQSEAPSEEVEAAAAQLVDAVTETPAVAEPAGPYAPRNDCADLDGAQNFLDMLNDAVEARDTDVLVALAADDVKLGFGGEDGAANLRRNLDAPGSTLWDQLAELEGLGCARNEQGGITLPWYFAQSFEGDPFETFIVTGNDVSLHQSADETSPRVAELAWDAVEALPDQQSPGRGPDESPAPDSWVHVRLIPQGGAEPAQGYVRLNQLRSVIDYRLIASSRNGRWRITALVAGD